MGDSIFYFHPKIGEDSHFHSYFSKGLKPPTSFVCLIAFFFVFSTMVNLLVREIPYFIIPMEGQTMPDPFVKKKNVLFVRQIQGLSLLGFGLEVRESSITFGAKKQRFFLR